MLRFERNTQGRDFAVGDIHGWFSKLQEKLDSVGFDPAVDRLFSVGDLVDRGPESPLVLEWLEKPWFHAVKGNHEEMLIGYVQVPPHCWGKHGVEWFYDISQAERKRYASYFLNLPVAIEVETTQGKVGIVHGECVNFSWADMVMALEGESGKPLRRQIAACLWARRRWQCQDLEPVEDVRAVIVGHTPVDAPAVLGNTHYIDTCAGQEAGYLTLINLETLETL